RSLGGDGPDAANVAERVRRGGRSSQAAARGRSLDDCDVGRGRRNDGVAALIAARGRRARVAVLAAAKTRSGRILCSPHRAAARRPPRVGGKMHMLRSRAALAVLCIGAARFGLVATASAQVIPNGEWPTYGGDLGSTRYAALDQINASNFGSLEIAWRFN